MAGHGFDVERATPLYLRTTQEMLEEFSYLGEGLAYEVVVKRPRELAESVQEMRPVPDGFHPPHIARGRGADSHDGDGASQGDLRPGAPAYGARRALNESCRRSSITATLHSISSLTSSSTVRYKTGISSARADPWVPHSSRRCAGSPRSIRCRPTTSARNAITSKSLTTEASPPAIDLPEKRCPGCQTPLRPGRVRHSL